LSTGRVPPSSVHSVSAEIRWGVVGPGRIAEKVVEDFAVVDGARAVAVASRSLQRAQDFAARHGLDRAYGSYAELLADPQVDVLYVATPHAQHAAIARAALQAGKALLVEKSFTATSAGAVEVVDLARSRGTFVMEAMWTRFLPAIVAVRDLIADNAIGEVRSVQADLGVQRAFDAEDRLFALELGGGALLDLGVYVVSFAQCCSARPTPFTPPGRCSPPASTPRRPCCSGTPTGARRR
jgi:predicted dehydrogenase